MTYEYVCTACGHEWEASQRISDKVLTVCPKCAKKTAKRLISGGTGFLLKGGGWYADGYASPGGSSAKKSEGDSSASSSSDDGAKAPAPKTEKVAAADKPAKAETKKAPSAAKAE